MEIKHLNFQFIGIGNKLNVTSKRKNSNHNTMWGSLYPSIISSKGNVHKKITTKMNVHSNFIHGNHTLTTTQIITSKENGSTCYGIHILVQQTTTTPQSKRINYWHSNMEKSQKYAEQRKPTKYYTLCGSI